MKWDERIRTASFESLSSYTWYLDLVSPGWEGLVKGDYEMVMPLTIKKKFGSVLLLQPILAQQLGVFAGSPPIQSDIEDFIKAIPTNVRYVDICLNNQNLDLPKSIPYYERINHELDLKNPSNYNTNTKRNLQKGLDHTYEFRKIGVDKYLDLKYSAERKVPVRRDYLENLFRGLEFRKRTQSHGLFLDGKLEAAAILADAGSRVIYMNGSSSIIGKENRAMFVLIDKLIESSRDKYKIFDFEGSSLPGVARFFEGFGAEGIPYPRIVKARFPFIRRKV